MLGPTTKKISWLGEIMNVQFLRHVSARFCVFIVCCLSLASCSREEAAVEAPPPAEPAAPVAAPTTALVDGARIANADSEPGNWMSNGRTYSEQRYSPLNEINESTVGDLGRFAQRRSFLQLSPSVKPPDIE